MRPIFPAEEATPPSTPNAIARVNALCENAEAILGEIKGLAQTMFNELEPLRERVSVLERLDLGSRVSRIESELAEARAQVAAGQR